MTPESVCRLCLVTDVSMHNIVDSPLRNIYEKLTDIPAGNRPVAACYLCHSQLRKCHALMTKAKTAYKLLKAIQESGVVVTRESIAMVNREGYRLNDGLCITHSEFIVIDPRCNIKVKIEDEALSCDVMEMKSEENIKCEVLDEVEYNGNDRLINREDMDNEVSEQTEVPTEGLTERSSIHNNYTKREIFESIEEIESLRLTNSNDYEMLVDANDVMREISDVEYIENEVLAAVRDIDHEMSEDAVVNEYDELIDIEDIKLEYTQDGAAPEQHEQTHNNTHYVASPTDNENSMNKSRFKTDGEENENVTKAIVTEHRFRHTDIQADKSRFDTKSDVDLNSSVNDGTGNNNASLQTAFICDYCCSEYETKYLLIEHITKCHKIVVANVTSDEVRQYNCTICDKRYIRKGFFRRHIKIHDENNDNATSGHISARILQDRTNARNNVQGSENISRHNDTALKKSYFDTNCDDRNSNGNIEKSSSSILQDRTNNIQDSQNISRHNDTALKKSYFDTNCDDGNSNDNIVNSNSQTKFICDHCDSIFDNNHLITEHMRVHMYHNSLKINLARYEGGPYGCNICEKTFTKKGLLARHTKTHSIEHKNVQKRNSESYYRTGAQKKKIECSICQRICSSKSALEVHARIHSNDKPYECPICKRKFTQIGHLNVHLRIHTGEKPFECTVCKRKFRQKYDMKLHFKTHTEMKPFGCSICERKFSQKQHLTSHITTHTSEKPFECTICNAKFKRKDSLNTHRKNHTGEKPFKCDTCLRSFSLNKILKKHLRTHRGEKTFK